MNDHGKLMKQMLSLLESDRELSELLDQISDGETGESEPILHLPYGSEEPVHEKEWAS